MSAVAALIADIVSFRKTHGVGPKRIRMHPHDVSGMLMEFTGGSFKPDDEPKQITDPDYAFTIVGVPVFRAYDAVVARPWLDL